MKYQCIRIILLCNYISILGKKTPVGHFVLGPDVDGAYGEQWKQALAKPGQEITKWQAFE